MSTLSTRTVRAFRRRILAHYDAHARDLPWRRESDPYRIWVSEVMLQQTRVDTVIPYYGRWLARFPDLRTLADAPEDDVLEAWAGLGYYSRARNLRGAAMAVRDRYGGVLPTDSAVLRELPGFGSYTAGAVASIAFGESVAAVDGNVRRVLGRAFAPESSAAPEAGDGSSPERAHPAARIQERRIQELANALVDPERPGDFNQALMDLGATICTPRAPRCGECPVARMCHARTGPGKGGRTKGPGPSERVTGSDSGGASERKSPRAKSAAPRPKQPTRHRSFVVAVIVDAAGRFLMVRRPLGGVLARMWAFPEVELGQPGQNGRGSSASTISGPVPAAAEHLVRTAVGVARSLGAGVGGGAPLPPVKHVFTHFTAHYIPVVMTSISRERAALPQAVSGDLRWVEPSLQRLAIPTAQKRIARAAGDHLGLQIAFTEGERS